MKTSLFSCTGALLLIIYTFYMWLCDLCRFIAYFTSLSLPLDGFLSGAFLLILILFLLAKSFPKLKELLPKREARGRLHFFMMAALLILLFAFYLLKGAFPDISEDVTKYHILLQEPKLRDMTGSDLFPGSFQGFGFPLPDRLFYPFRSLLGYRAGTILNLICLMLIFVQSEHILYRLTTGLIRHISPILSFLAVCQYDLLLQVSTYMVELSSLVLILEALYILLCFIPSLSSDGETSAAEKGLSRAQLFPISAYFTFLCGMIFAAKMTNIIYAAPLILIYVFDIRKQVTPRLFILCFLIGLLPVSIYLIHNYSMTGNPVFPYYNTIFDSPYFPDIDFKDERWGGKGLVEKLLWPFLLISDPGYAKSELPAPYTLGLLSAWVATGLFILGLLIKAFKRLIRGSGEVNKSLTSGSLPMETLPRPKMVIVSKSLTSGSLPSFARLLFFVVCCSLMWSFSTGHSRYYMAGSLSLMLLGIIATDGMGRLFSGYEASTLLRLKSLAYHGLALFLMLLMLPGPYISAKKAILSSDWTGTMPIADRTTWKQYLLPLETGEPASRKEALAGLYKDNWGKAGRDKNFTAVPYDEYSEGKNVRPDSFVLFGYSSMPAVLYDPDIPIISWKYITEYPDDAEFSTYCDMMEGLLTEHTAATIIESYKGTYPDLAAIYEQRFDIDALLPLKNDIYNDRDLYIAYLKGLPEDICDLEMTAPLPLISRELKEIGYLSGDKKELSLSITVCGPSSYPWGNITKGHKIEIFIEGDDEPVLLKSIIIGPEEKSRELKLDVSGLSGLLYGRISPADPTDEPVRDAFSEAIDTALDIDPEPTCAAWVKTDLYGHQCIGGSWYQLNEDGTARSGWIDEGGQRFYGDEDHVGRLSVGWRSIDGKWYYFYDNGAMATGWLEYNGNTYYLYEDGSMAEGTAKIDGIIYSFDESGALLS